jgi:hypothetical protein
VGLDWVTASADVNNTGLGPAASLGVRVPAGATLMRLHFGFHVWVTRAAEDEPIKPEPLRALIWGVRWVPADTPATAIGTPNNPADQTWLLTGFQRPLNEVVNYRVLDNAPLVLKVTWGLDRTLESSEARRKAPDDEDRDLWFGCVLDLGTLFEPTDPEGSTFWRALVKTE